MGSDSDDIVSLPSPPPPRPAARKAAIETALRKFDGVEEPVTARPARQRARRIQWATLNRRPAGALMAAAIIAVVFIPAIEIVMRDRPSEIATEEGAPAVRPAQDAVVEADSANVAAPAQAEEVVAASDEPSPTRPASPSVTRAGVRPGRLSAESDGMVSPPAPVMAAPAPPPLVSAPPPPRPPPPQEAADEGNIVVTGSRVPRRTMESASPLAIVDPYGEFLSRLQAGLRSNDRRAVIGLIGFPLRVNFGGESRTYRSPRDVERDFERIFTRQVRRAVLNQRADTLISRDEGGMIGNGRIWFGPTSADGSIRMREVNP